MAQEPKTTLTNETNDAATKETPNGNDNSNNEKQKSQSITEQVKDGIFSLTQKVSSLADDAKEQTANAIDSLHRAVAMKGQLRRARESLEKFLSPDLDIEKQIPILLMRECAGIVLLTSIKASLGFGGAIGTGIIISKLPPIKNGINGWSGPCSIGMICGSAGLNFGAQQTDFVIILRDAKSVNVFKGNGQIKFGADVSISAGKLGRNAQIGVASNEYGDVSATVSYSQSKGFYVGFALEGQGIVVRRECNEQFYGKEVNVKDILSSNMMDAMNVENEDYDAMIALLKEYEVKKTKGANECIQNEE